MFIQPLLAFPFQYLIHWCSLSFRARKENDKDYELIDCPSSTKVTVNESDLTGNIVMLSSKEFPRLAYTPKNAGQASDIWLRVKPQNQSQFWYYVEEEKVNQSGECIERSGVHKSAEWWTNIDKCYDDVSELERKYFPWWVWLVGWLVASFHCRLRWLSGTLPLPISRGNRGQSS